MQFALSLVAFTLAMAVAPLTFAQGRQAHAADMSTRLGAKLLIGVGGEAEYDDFRWQGIGFGADFDDDLDTMQGLGLFVDVPVHDYVIVGGFFNAYTWNSETVEDATDNFALYDIGASVKGRYPTHIGKLGFEPSVTLQLGFSANIPDDDIDDWLEDGSGWNLALLFGGTLFVTDNIGLLLELGYVGHAVSHEFDLPGGGDGDIGISNGTFNLGVLFAL